MLICRYKAVNFAKRRTPHKKGERFSQKITKKEVCVLSLGDFIKHIRMRHGMNQTQFGDLFFRNKDYVYLIENDKAVPTAQEMQLISEKLNEPLIMFIYVGFSVNKIMAVK